MLVDHKNAGCRDKLPLIATGVNRKLNIFLQFSIFRKYSPMKTHDFEANQPFKGFHSLKHGSRHPAVRSPGLGAWGEQSLHGSAPPTQGDALG
ncbi:MAG: hypothetical protein NTV46_04300 [Verrucomicrobia bacterium]|nr:hypothetical protein [Verrucomicrobiota bacterium]